MNFNSSRILLVVFAAFSLFSLSAFAGPPNPCRLLGTYGYLYNGTSYAGGGSVPLTETGYFTIEHNGSLSGEGTVAFYFSNFGGSGQPLWLLINEIQANGEVIQNQGSKCTGTIQFLATGTVIKTSNPSLIPEGTVLFADSQRSIAYTISGSA
jgi:hypothetical protein